MHRLVPLLSAAVLALVGTACDEGDAGETLEQVGDTLSEAATEASDAVSEAATGARDATTEFADLVGFCDAARRVEAAVDARNAGDALEAAEDLAAEAPEDVAAAAATVREGVRSWHGGDRAALEDDAFRGAAEDVRRVAEERCDPRS